MTAERALTWLLRFIAITTIPAFIAGVIPQSWLAFMLHRIEPAMPIGILTTYLTRILMLLYAYFGLHCFIFATDIRRYLPLIWILGLAALIFTVIALIVLFVSVPADHRAAFFWLVCFDFSDGLVKGVLIVLLLLRLPASFFQKL